MKVFLLTVELPQHGIPGGDEKRVVHVVKTLSLLGTGTIKMYCPVEILMQYDVQQRAIDISNANDEICHVCRNLAGLYPRLESPWD